MSANVKFKISDLPPHLRMQAERQITAMRNPKVKITPSAPQKKQPPIRVPKVRQPNGTEARYVSDHPGQWHYEALSFKCPSGHYTPDWIMFRHDGHIVAVEVKGSYAFASQAAASAKFKECVATYPDVVWVWATWIRGKGKRDGYWNCGHWGYDRDRHQ